MAQISKPSNEIEVTIQDQKFKVKYPSSGEMIDIASLKTQLSSGQYSQLLVQRSSESGLAVRLIDAYAFFTIMVPTLRDQINVKSLYDLEIIDSVEVIHVYDNIIVPWMEQWIEIINKRINDLLGVEGEKNTKRGLI
jgi:uncharacterized protein with NAD-binding domain and iron-sulfur cluster